MFWNLPGWRKAGTATAKTSLVHFLSSLFFFLLLLCVWLHAFHKSRNLLGKSITNSPFSEERRPLAELSVGCFKNCVSELEQNI